MDLSSMWLKNDLKTLFILMPRHLKEVLKMEDSKICQLVCILTLTNCFIWFHDFLTIPGEYNKKAIFYLPTVRTHEPRVYMLENRYSLPNKKKMKRGREKGGNGNKKGKKEK
jgi:hypothetical protein